MRTKQIKRLPANGTDAETELESAWHKNIKRMGRESDKYLHY